MDLPINHRQRIVKDTVMHVNRSFTVRRGEFHVSVGQEVHPEDILGYGEVIAGFKILNIAALLEVPPAKGLLYLKRRLGQIIYEGEILAQKDGLFGLGQKVIQAPSDGMLEAYDEKTGQLRLKIAPKKETLVSGVFGIIDHIEPLTGQATIKTMASTIYGVAGSGKDRSGIVHCLGKPDMFVSSKQVDESLVGRILVGGAVLFADAIQKAINAKIAGIVTGGMDAKDYRGMAGGHLQFTSKHWSDIGISILVTEGFVSQAIDQELWKFLQDAEGFFAIMDGNRAQLILPSRHPESINTLRKTALPLNSKISLEEKIEIVPLQVGQNVRIVSEPNLGTIGKVISIDQSMTKLGSGISTYLVTLQTGASKLQVPYQNLEGVW